MPVVTERFVEHAWRRGCDFILLDLEDSVPAHAKELARALVRDAIGKVGRGGAEVGVRINHDSVDDDVEAALWPGVSFIRYPKAEAPDEIRRLDRIITRLERERGMPPGSVAIEPGLETALGFAHVMEIAAASHRVRELGCPRGGYDLSRDLGIDMFVDYDQFMYLRGEVELAAAALGKDVLGAAPFMANPSGSVTDDTRAFRQAEAARRCGLYLGGGGLNPAVVDSHNRGYTPTEDEMRTARWVLDEFARIDEAGVSWEVVDGQVIDRYAAAHATKLLDYAAACSVRDRAKAVTAAAKLAAARLADPAGQS